MGTVKATHQMVVMTKAMSMAVCMVRPSFSALSTTSRQTMKGMQLPT